MSDDKAKRYENVEEFAKDKADGVTLQNTKEIDRHGEVKKVTLRYDRRDINDIPVLVCLECGKSADMDIYGSNAVKSLARIPCNEGGSQ